MTNIVLPSCLTPPFRVNMLSFSHIIRLATSIYPGDDCARPDSIPASILYKKLAAL